MPSGYTKKDLAECAYREVTKRRENYPKWVRERKMTQETADRQTAMMQAIYQVIIALPDDFLHNAQS